MEDKRFKHIVTDPKFRRIPKGEKKVKIDKRFQSMFKDKKFEVKYTTDKTGRPINHTSAEDLKRYYVLSSESEDEDTNDANTQKSDTETENQLKVKHKSDKTISNKIKKKLKNLNVDYARGESVLCSESSSDEESEESVSDTESIEHKWGELDADAESTEEATYRLAACNMDWDRIRAIDLMVLFNSFLPSGGIIKSVTIYPSEFGKARMNEEEIKGPIELVESKTEENKDENEEGSQYHMEKLRQYQLNRLKYYYAVVVFNNANSANKIYTECDGMEYESSAVKLDLRFIPDDMDFNEEPKDFCDKLPEISKYQPRFFTTTALQQAKVNLTWDETDPDRLEFTQKVNSGKVDDISEADLQNYLASSSGEEASENENSENSDEVGKSTVDKYKALLQNIEEKEKSKNGSDVEMEISWGLDLKEKTEKIIKEKASISSDKTPFQQYLEKRKEKRKQKRQQRKNQIEKDGSESDSDVPSDIDLSDPYFAEEFNSSDFKPKRKKKINKKGNNNSTDDDSDEQHQAELELLLMNEDDNRKHFSLKKIQENEDVSKKKKKIKAVEKHDDFEINVNDERFSALYTSHHYNIDPTDPHFKKTKAMDTLVGEKLKRRNEEPEKSIEFKKRKSNKKNSELSILVKSIKKKSKDFKNK